MAASTTARGYGGTHQKLRASLRPTYVPGVTLCWRCGRPITGPWSRVHLGHDDYDRTIYRGLEHQRCNIGASNRSLRRKRRRLITSRRW